MIPKKHNNHTQLNNIWTQPYQSNYKTESPHKNNYSKQTKQMN